MNEYEIDEALERYRDHPVLGPATQTLHNLKRAVNRNSDGWPYWQAPRVAAAKLMVLIDGRGSTGSPRGYRDRENATPDALRAALSPVKGFRARHGLDFEIVESFEQMPKPPSPTYRVTITMDAHPEDKAGDGWPLALMGAVERALQASGELAGRFPGRLVGMVGEMSDSPEPYRSAFRLDPLSTEVP